MSQPAGFWSERSQAASRISRFPSDLPTPARDGLAGRAFDWSDSNCGLSDCLSLSARSSDIATLDPPDLPALPGDRASPEESNRDAGRDHARCARPPTAPSRRPAPFFSFFVFTAIPLMRAAPQRIEEKSDPGGAAE